MAETLVQMVDVATGLAILQVPEGMQGQPGTTGAPLGDAIPLMDGTADPGSSTSGARDDHRHPSDTSRAPASGIDPTAITGTAVVTSDGRLSDARTPSSTLPHKATHATGQTDALAPSDIGAIASSEKAAALGVATLDAGGKIPTTQLPALAITTTFVVNTQAAMLALDAQEGDVAVRTDLSKSLILAASPASTLGNWQELLTPTDAVSTVDGRTGAVTLSDLYAALVHKSRHASGGADALSPADIGAAPSSGISPLAIAGTAVITTDPRLADPRTPAAHKTSHQAGGTDELLLSQAQVASLQSDLAAKAALASPTFTGTPTVPGYVATPGAWTAYTPTLSGTGWSYGNATVDCAYTQVGKIVHVRGLIVWGSTSTFGAAAGPQMTLPVAGLSSTHRHLGYLTFFDSSASRNAPGVILVPSTTLMTPLYVREVGWLDALISTTPFAWATGDAFRFSLTYEAA